MKSRIKKLKQKNRRGNFEAGELVSPYFNDPHQGLVILVTGDGEADDTFAGIVIHTPDSSAFELGEFDERWDRETFFLFEDEITLSN